MGYEIARGGKLEAYFHEDLEGIYVVNGEADVSVMDREYHLQKGDMIFADPGLSFSVSAGEGSILCRVRYSPEILRSVIGEKDISVRCNSCAESGKSYDSMRRIFREIILDYVQEKEKDICRERSLLYWLLSELLRKFAVVENSGMAGKAAPEEDARLTAMLRYVSRNYRENIRLSDLSEQMYTSVSTLSRLFKKKTGMNFAEYVMQVRLREVSRELVYTDSNITKIAMDCGFSNFSVFSRAFHEKYGISPSEYRSSRREKETTRPGKEDIKDDEALRKELVTEFGPVNENSGEGKLSLELDSDSYSSWKKIWNQTINVGAASSLFLANAQYHVTYLAENLGFRYVRLWNVFSGDMRLTDGMHIGNYSFDKIDLIFDFLYQYKLIPYLDFGSPRPETAIRKEDEVVYYVEGKSLFQSREAWEGMVRSFLQHMAARYGNEYLEEWIFEFGYDMRHKQACYVDENYDYFNAYSFLYRTVKEMFPEAEVGGPCCTLNYDPEFLNTFLKKAEENCCAPDFISIILFPYQIEKKTA